MRPGGKVYTAITIIVTVLVLAILLLIIDLRQLLVSLENINLYYFGAALILMPPFILLKTYRWFFIVRLKARISFNEALISYLAGNYVALVTPAKVGELSRVLYLPVDEKPKFSGSVIIDKMFDLLALVLLSCAGCFIIFGAEAGLLMLSASLVIVAAMAALGRSVAYLKNAGLPKWLGFVVQIGEIASLRPADIAASLLISLGIFAIVLAQCYCLVSAFQPVSVTVILFSFPLIILTNVLPVTISGLGVRESAALFILSRFGVAGPAAVSSAFLIFFINTVVPGIAGALLVTRFRLDNGPANDKISSAR